MIHVVVGGLVVVMSGLALIAAALNAIVAPQEGGELAETLVVSGIYVICFVLGVLTVRGSSLGGNVLAIALVGGAVVFWVSAFVNRGVPGPGVLVTSHTFTLWDRVRAPLVLSLLGGALTHERCNAYRRQRQAVEQ